MHAAIGDPVKDRNRYRVRFLREGVPPNYLGGRIFLFPDAEDHLVPVGHSRRLVTAMQAVRNDRLTYSETGPGSASRWLHGLSNKSSPLIASEPTWLGAFASGRVPAWNFPRRGRVLVHGWLRTKWFEVRLGELDDAVAKLEFNIDAGRFQLWSLTGPTRVTIKSGRLHIEQEIGTADDRNSANR